MAACDVLVVGGGPAGSSCAWALRKAGLDVLVLDKAPFPRHKVCAGWITPAVFRGLGVDPAEYGCNRVLQPITGFRVSVMGAHPAHIRYGRPVSYGILRSEFDHYLLERSGARLRLGEPLASLERSGRRWLANGEVRAALVVAAGGHFCPVARLLRWPAGGETVVALEVEARVDGRPCAVEPETPELYFRPDLTGYGWCLRKGDWLNAGFGRTGPEGIRGEAETFLQGLERDGKIPPPAGAALRGHAYRLWSGRSDGLADDGVVRIGDSAGLAFPQSGEGIRPAVASGLLAAQAIAEAQGDFSKERLTCYARRLSALLGVTGRRGLSGSWKRTAGRILLSRRWFVRHVVLDRWFLRIGARGL